MRMPALGPAALVAAAVFWLGRERQLWSGC